MGTLELGVHVVDDRIVDRVQRLIRPPRLSFAFTYIHGIRWQDVQDQPSFGPSGPSRQVRRPRRVPGAHNASFDRRVLHACCEASGLPMPAIPFVCTVTLARRVWRLPSSRLDAVCQHLGVELDHHQALSDAEACARILLHARLADPNVVSQMIEKVCGAGVQGRSRLSS